jgi:hypothetical protein
MMVHMRRWTKVALCCCAVLGGCGGDDTSPAPARAGGAAADYAVTSGTPSSGRKAASGTALAWTDPRASLRAARPGGVPADGAQTVAGISLPEGRRVRDEKHHVVAWMTPGVPADLPRLWSRLAAAFPRTGLWPLVAIGEDGQPPRFDDGLAPRPDRARRAARSPLAVLREGGRLYETDDSITRLAPASTASRRDAVVTAMDAARPLDGDDLSGLLLVPTRRPADAIADMGWSGPLNMWQDDTASLSAVLRSWEDRYDAIPVALGFDTLTLAVRRPPVTADGIAREQGLFAPDIVYQGTDTVEALAREIERSPTAWWFWWD